MYAKRIAVLVSAAAALSLLGPVTPAGAVPGQIIVSAVTAFDSTTGKGATATCPSGKRVLGTGWKVTGADGQVTVEQVVPDAALTQVGAFAREDGTGTALSWSLEVFAVCASVSGGTVVMAAGVSSSQPKTVPATCPTGYKVTGAGFAISGGAGEVHVDSVEPAALLASVTVSAREDGAYLPTWQLRAYAVCTPSSQVPGLVLVSGTSPLGSGPSQGAGAICPAGKMLTGAAAAVLGGGDEVLIPVVWPSGPGSVRAVGTEDDGGYGGTWQSRAYAICAF